MTEDDRSRQQWSDRFRKVILGEGYSPRAADRILTEYLDVYLKDCQQFNRMLTEYEQEQKNDR